MPDILTGHDAEVAVLRLTLRNPGLAEVIKVLAEFVLDLDGMIGVTPQNPPITYDLSFTTRDRGLGDQGATVSFAAPSSVKTLRWRKKELRTDALFVRMYLHPLTPVPEEFEYLRGLAPQQGMDKYWISKHIYSNGPRLAETKREISAIASPI
jgi:hypothetical protein